MPGLVVAGFHRSGTSALGQVLDSYGFPLGLDLMDGNEFNRFGYFECWEVVRHHDTVLKRLGVNWSMPLDDPITLTRSENQWIQDYAKRRAAVAENWAVKDPRMCRFMLQWKEQIPDLKVLIVYRNIAESCQSLMRRSNLEMARSGDTNNIARRFFYDQDLALRLWVDHNQCLLDVQRAYPDDCVVIGHHHIISGYDTMAMIQSRFGMAPSQTPDQSTLDPSAISEKTSKLFYRDEKLMSKALLMWDQLQSLDTAVAEGLPRLDIGSAMEHDPDGKLAYGAMAEIQLPELHKWLKQQQVLTKGMRSLSKKATKFPFNLYFMNRKKYRDVIEQVLAQ